jgi:hypothetical protein
MFTFQEVNEMNDDLDSTTYNVREIEIDPRFKDGFKDLLFVVISAITFNGIAIYICYALGSDLEKLTFILGYPSWFFWATVILLVGVVYFTVWFLKFFKTPSLKARADNRSLTAEEEKDE